MFNISAARTMGKSSGRVEEGRPKGVTALCVYPVSLCEISSGASRKRKLERGREGVCVCVCVLLRAWMAFLSLASLSVAVYWRMIM